MQYKGPCNNCMTVSPQSHRPVKKHPILLYASVSRILSWQFAFDPICRFLLDRIFPIHTDGLAVGPWTLLAERDGGYNDNNIAHKCQIEYNSA